MFDDSLCGELVEQNKYSLVRRQGAQERRDIAGRLSELLRHDNDVCGRRHWLQLLASALLGLRRPIQTLLHGDYT